jgi:UDP-glucuronate 4-epimerase
MLAVLEKNLGKTAKLKKMAMQPGDVTKTYADIAKAKHLLAYQPATNFQNGIKIFVEWFLGK